jgi:flagellar hook-basal body complex protein FliE
VFPGFIPQEVVAVMAIGEITQVLPAVISPSSRVESGSGAPPAASFSALMKAIESTSADANTAVAGMLDGSTDVHDAMIALQRADMTLQLSVQIRNKLVQAYQEIMRMPV